MFLRPRGGAAPFLRSGRGVSGAAGSRTVTIGSFRVVQGSTQSGGGGAPGGGGGPGSGALGDGALGGGGIAENVRWHRGSGRGFLE